ncbi:MAG: hypothetical protein R3F61_22710 [Myxococcota bacterium]
MAHTDSAAAVLDGNTGVSIESAPRLPEELQDAIVRGEFHSLLLDLQGCGLMMGDDFVEPTPRRAPRRAQPASTPSIPAPPVFARPQTPEPVQREITPSPAPSVPMNAPRFDSFPDLPTFDSLAPTAPLVERAVRPPVASSSSSLWAAAAAGSLVALAATLAFVGVVAVLAV